MVILILIITSSNSIHSQDKTQIQKIAILVERYKSAIDSINTLITALDVSDKEIVKLKQDKETLLAGFNKLMEDYKICQAEPKTVIEYNSRDWYFYTLGGSAITVITYFIFKLWVLKK